MAERCRFVASDAFARRPPTETFDVIIAKDVIEHVPDDQSLLADFARRQRPGSQLLVSTQSALSLTFLVERWYFRVWRGEADWCGWDPTHLRFYTPRSLGRELRAAGYRPRRRHGFYIVPYRILTYALLFRRWIELPALRYIDLWLGGPPALQSLRLGCRGPGGAGVSQPGGRRSPRVTVVMPVYNAEPYLRDALAGVLEQTFEDFELLAVDDGSTDGSLDVLRSCCDPRLRVVPRSHVGVVRTMNTALGLARAELIARADADDVCLPDRLERQVRFLAEYPGVALVGGAMRSGTRLFEYPRDAARMRWLALYQSPVANTTILFRRRAALVVGGYPEDFQLVDDYPFVSRLLARYDAANLADPLVLHRPNPAGISGRHGQAQAAEGDRVRRANIATLVPEPGAAEALFRMLLGPRRACRTRRSAAARPADRGLSAVLGGGCRPLACARPLGRPRAVPAGLAPRRHGAGRPRADGPLRLVAGRGARLSAVVGEGARQTSRPAAGRPVSPGRRATLLGVAGVAALGLAVRLLFLREDSTFQRTDEVMFVLNSLKLHEFVAPQSAGRALTELFWMFAFPWGYPVLLFTWSLMELSQALGFGVNEATVIAPFAVLGAVAPVLVFLLGRRLFSPVVGLAAAAAVAVLPSHAAQSRTIAAWILASNLFLLVVLAYLRYRDTFHMLASDGGAPAPRRPAVRTAGRAARPGSGLALAAYLPSDNLAPGGVALLVLHALSTSVGSAAARARDCFALFWRREILVLPALSVAPLVAVHLVFVVTGRGTYGFIGHYFVSKVAPGLHLGPLLAGLATNAGPALSLLLILGAVRGAVALVRGDRGLVLALWVVAFGVPTAFMVNPAGTVVLAYLTPMLLPLLVLGCAAIVEAAEHASAAVRPLARTLAAVALAVLVGWTAVMIPSRVYGMLFLGPADPIGLWGGETYLNDGAKTAGYYIRTSTPPGSVVLSDLRLFVGKYYFHRKTLLPPEGTVRGPVDVLAVTRGFRARVDTTGYTLAATVTHGGAAGVLRLHTGAGRRPRARGRGLRPAL